MNENTAALMLTDGLSRFTIPAPTQDVLYTPHKRSDGQGYVADLFLHLVIAQPQIYEADESLIVNENTADWMTPDGLSRFTISAPTQDVLLTPHKRSDGQGYVADLFLHLVTA